MSRLAEAKAALDAHRNEQQSPAPDLFSLPVESETITSAIERVADRAGLVWRDEVLDAIERIARRQDTLVADHVWRDLESRGEGVTYDRRALGAVLREAVKRGLIVSTSDYAPSSRRHSSPLRVWRSRLRGDR